MLLMGVIYWVLLSLNEPCDIPWRYQWHDTGQKTNQYMSFQLIKILDCQHNIIHAHQKHTVELQNDRNEAVFFIGRFDFY